MEKNKSKSEGLVRQRFISRLFCLFSPRRGPRAGVSFCRWLFAPGTVSTLTRKASHSVRSGARDIEPSAEIRDRKRRVSHRRDRGRPASV